MRYKSPYNVIFYCILCLLKDMVIYMKISLSSRVAVKIGGICILTYMASYFFRNILSVFTPELLKEGVYTKTQIAFVSSVYMIVYALGQLVNGIAGDYIKPKIMTFSGLMLSGTGLILFSVIDNYGFTVFAFGILGFGLSTLRGPLVKMITENTRKRQSRMCCTLLSVASFTGPFIASAFAIIFKWQTAFTVAGIISFGFAIGSYILISRFEKIGLIRTKRIKKNDNPALDVLGVFKIEKFVPYLFISMVIEIISTSVSFWIPTYTSEALNFSVGESGLIFSVISLSKATAPFICLYLLSKIGENDMRLVRAMFSLSLVAFLLMLFIKNRWMNIFVFLFALIAVSIASSVLWNVYIPQIGKTGKASSANGILDCSAYFAASLANMLFAVIVQNFSWSGMIVSWLSVVIAGFMITVVDFIVRER